MPITPPLFTSTFPDGDRPDALQPSHWNAVTGLLERVFESPAADGQVLVKDAASNEGATWAPLPDLPSNVALRDAANVFTEDQTIEGNLIVTGEINPARWAEQKVKIRRLERAPEAQDTGVRTLLSETLTAGMSLRHDDGSGVGKITVGNYDTQEFQPLQLEAEHFSLLTGTFPPGLEEHSRFHASGGVTHGVGTDHAVDPGLGIIQARGLGTTPLDANRLTSGTVPPARLVLTAETRLWGRGQGVGPGAVQEITLGPGLQFEGTTLTVTSSGVVSYQFATATTAPPSNQTLRFDAPHPYTAVTKLWADYDSTASEDLYWGWLRLEVGASVLVQDKDNHLQWAEVRITAAPIDKGSYVELPCAWLSNGAALATQAVIVRVTPGLGQFLARLDAIEARLQALEASRGY